MSSLMICRRFTAVKYASFLENSLAKNGLCCRHPRQLSALTNATSPALKQSPVRTLCTLPPPPPQQTDYTKPVEIGGGTWKEIYEGLLSTQVKLVKSFSLGTTLIGLSLQPVIINYLGSSLSLVVSFSAVIGMFTFVTPALIHWFTRKYVFSIRYDEKTDLYAATTLSFFLREKTIKFRLSDVEVPTAPLMFTTFLVKDKPLFVDVDTFTDVAHFGRIMGYDVDQIEKRRQEGF